MNIVQQAKLFLLQSFLEEDLCTEDNKVTSEYFSENYLLNDTIGGLLEEHVGNETLQTEIKKQYENFLYDYEVLESKRYNQEMKQEERYSWNDDLLKEIFNNWLNDI